MAHNAKIARLTDELIQTILKFDPATNKQAYKHAKDVASRGLRGHQYARPSQFEVKASFSGLDEKFRVKNRDDLADALQVRLAKLDDITNRFKPEFLSLLLLLADRPLENTRVEALELLRPPSPVPPLEWQEILREDPYSDEEIWQDIDYAVESSGDEQIPKKRGKATRSPPTSVEEDDICDPEPCIVPAAADLISQLEATQFWKLGTNEDDTKIDITEIQTIRETLFMLAGLRTNLYQINQEQCRIRVSSKYALRYVMAPTIAHLLSQFTSIGEDVYSLRQWAKKPSALPLVQTFEAVVRTRLAAYDQSLVQLQKRYLAPSEPIPVSLLELYLDIETLSVPLLRLAQLQSNIEAQLLVNPFSYLEALFEQTALAQMTLEKDVFEYMSRTFFECLQTYLKPIRQWMEAGELGSDDETFFVFTNDSSSDAGSLWHDRYVLRRDSHDKLRCPSFLQPAAQKIFNTGKSVVFLKRLGVYDVSITNPGGEPMLEHETVCGATTEVPLSPFPELFQAAFETWIRSKYSVASTVLGRYIFETGGLIRTLVILETLYLGKNGAVFEEFANTLFERMDAGRRGWNDRYVLTEVARGVFGTVLPVADAEKIVVRSMKVKNQRHSVKGLTGLSIDYALPWTIQNIIQRPSLPTYQQVFTLLLQIYRVKFLVQRVRPSRTHKLDRAQSQLTYKLQHRLTWFTNTLRSYLTETVIFFTTRDMDITMEKAEDIDEMSSIHDNHVAKLQERALLTNELKPIRNAVVELLDLGVLLAETVAATSTKDATSRKRRQNVGSKKSSATPNLKEELSDSDASDDGDGGETLALQKQTVLQNPREVLQTIDKEFSRLLPFVTAGLRSVGRAGAEPMWEQLAERLEWEGKKDRPL